MTKSLLLAATLLTACGSSGSGPTPQPASPDAAGGERDWCAVVPAEVANLALDGAAADPQSYGGPRNGTCTWHGKADAELMVSIDQNGVDREIFDQGCHDYEAAPIAAPFGIAACSHASTTLVLADDDTILIAIGTGTTDT